MKLSFPLAAAFAVVVSLTACGGGGSSSSTNSSGNTGNGGSVANPVVFTKTDTVVGTGAEATAGKKATVTYTGWLYSATAAGNKGSQFDTGSFSFTLGAKQVIDGFDQGVLGMKVGGKRTVLIPSNMGYGASGQGPIPPSADLVFEITLTAVQ